MRNTNGSSAALCTSPSVLQSRYSARILSSWPWNSDCTRPLVNSDASPGDFSVVMGLHMFVIQALSTTSGMPSNAIDISQVRTASSSTALIFTLLSSLCPRSVCSIRPSISFLSNSSRYFGYLVFMRFGTVTGTGYSIESVMSLPLPSRNEVY